MNVPPTFAGNFANRIRRKLTVESGCEQKNIQVKSASTKSPLGKQKPSFMMVTGRTAVVRMRTCYTVSAGQPIGLLAPALIQKCHVRNHCGTNIRFDMVTGDMEQEIPRTTKWMIWWLRPGVASMIFRSKTVMHEEPLRDATRTTNGVESFHRNISRFVQQSEPIFLYVTTTFQLFAQRRE
ncbi:hypothetical protein BDB00DRAFT_871703 [Zychaea mexicana]|uniref:uncharacterized protein n=1 Tax=Zychaea mexicana TaxID=64656 RepID=UPI0022FDFFEE|nr:uncharacterized protein BDB00DRAFT_871703 [Zychaea mexicana]KAI9494181.1 hypothetical protein BDB00DRAFT_871703 [Zychaea mexicana]